MAQVPASLWASPDLLQWQLEGGSVAEGRLSPMPPDALPRWGMFIYASPTVRHPLALLHREAPAASLGT